MARRNIVNTRLDDSEKAWLLWLANHRGTSMSEALRYVLIKERTLADENEWIAKEQRDEGQDDQRQI